MQFHEKKNLDLFDFTSFFAWTFLNFLTCCGTTRENLGRSSWLMMLHYYFFSFFFWPDCTIHIQSNLFSFAEPSVPQKYVRTETVMGRKIFEFKSYRDGQLFRFDVPLDTRIATWRFLSNFTRGCIPGTVSV